MEPPKGYMERLLTDTLQSRGFEVTAPIKGAGHAAIFCVREAGDTKDMKDSVYVAKVVSLTPLDAKGKAAALQEVSMLRGLAPHPNLIAYKDSFVSESAGVLLIVMSFAEDGDLRRIVTRTQAARMRFPEVVVLWWVRQMLAGLQHLHSQGVVHRDLKSSNIFLCESSRRIRIGDFGISRVLESTAFATSCVGTPAYMSPELMRNEKYDYHVDMWALGCICYELCTLDLPFEATSLLDLVNKVIDGEPDWRKCGDFSIELVDVAKQLLKKDATARPTADQLMAASLFAEGSRAATEPSDDVWQSVGLGPA
mmetsp:Transcript_9234/g.20614  ORF Transcript_9234/g.20614 Transcript_9234/m.20614 type:complete len:310 (+) Transcript_9234:146-1075(+)|eukprot:CAMPEP_0178441966 /NCGR_PEP_ID=MMETSP0689_2-20121128/37853_1 /TAXON_ID=160604 /ORGANISM="Amphidinium massartii, Strain CS-259" /LENGTH=309 /DNA_ID=CAMNT_0020065361 /DNA_START=24 /DNA_END=953 /DNA_ORIENTATION=+